MPELPEVETIKNDLRDRVVGKKIKSVKVNLGRAIKSPFNEFLTYLRDNKIRRISRTGKLIIFELAGYGKFLLVHLKMTGQLIYAGKKGIIPGGHADIKTIKGLPNKYTRVIIEFTDNTKLFFNDMRTFGYLKLADKDELDAILARFGPEPVNKDFNFGYLKKILGKRTANIKSLLLNQQITAGIGNIYADEILFRSRVMPDRPGSSLSDNEIKMIVKASRQVLRAAIKYRGTTFNDYVDAAGNTGSYLPRLRVYGRAGEKCSGCGQEIRKKKLAGRGTHYCPNCQR